MIPPTAVFEIIMFAVATALVVLCAGWHCHAVGYAVVKAAFTKEPRINSVHRLKQCCIPMSKNPVHIIRFEFKESCPLGDIEWTIVNYTGILKQYVHSVSDNVSDEDAVLTYEVYMCKNCYYGVCKEPEGTVVATCTRNGVKENVGCNELLIVLAGSGKTLDTPEDRLMKVTFASGCATGYSGRSLK
jgi:hypothetical protein